MKGIAVSLCALFIFALCLTVSTPSYAGTCGNVTLDLQCPKGQALQGIDKYGNKKCIRPKLSKGCRTLSAFYGKGKTIGCFSNEFLLNITISDEGDSRDYQKDTYKPELGGKIKAAGGGGWFTITCCKDDIMSWY